METSASLKLPVPSLFKGVRFVLSALFLSVSVEVGADGFARGVLGVPLESFSFYICLTEFGIS